MFLQRAPQHSPQGKLMKLDYDILMEKAARIKLLVLDVDGVLTDGTIVYDSSGEQIQAFHVHDGLGIKLLQKHGVHVAIITARGSDALSKRARELGIEYLYENIQHKVRQYLELAAELGVTEEETCYIGDDLIDIKMLKLAGLGVTVPNSASTVRDYAQYVTGKPGGMGAVREVCDLILKAKGLWGEILNGYAAI